MFYSVAQKSKPLSSTIIQWRKSREGQGTRPPPKKNVGWGGAVMHHVPPNMAEISLHIRKRTVQLQSVVESLGLFT